MMYKLISTLIINKDEYLEDEQVSGGNDKLKKGKHMKKIWLHRSDNELATGIYPYILPLSIFNTSKLPKCQCLLTHYAY
ncbi:unnamed protein product [Heterobilharzia americana]|nr:unnamed protein product [Heterobilharzia americana]